MTPAEREFICTKVDQAARQLVAVDNADLRDLGRSLSDQLGFLQMRRGRAERKALKSIARSLLRAQREIAKLTATAR